MKFRRRHRRIRERVGSSKIAQANCKRCVLKSCYSGVAVVSDVWIHPGNQRSQVEYRFGVKVKEMK